MIVATGSKRAVAGVWRGVNYASMTTPAEQLEVEMTKAASVSNDGVTVTRRSLGELIEYEKHLASSQATASPVGALKAMILRIVPPGGH